MEVVRVKEERKAVGKPIEGARWSEWERGGGSLRSRRGLLMTMYLKT